MEKKSLKSVGMKIALHALQLVVFFALEGIKIFRLNPFSAAFLGAIMWLGGGTLLPSVEFILAVVLTKLSFERLFCALAFACVLTVAFSVHALSSLKVRPFLMIAYLVFGAALSVFLGGVEKSNFISRCLTVGLLLLSNFVFISAGKCLVNFARGKRPAREQLCSLFVLFFLCFRGTYTLQISVFSPFLAMTSAAVLFLATTRGKDVFPAAFTAALAAYFSGSETGILVLIVAVSLAAFAFCDLNRFLSAFAMLGVYVALAFTGAISSDPYAFFSFLFGLMPVLMIPGSAFSKDGEVRSEQMATRALINRNRHSIGKRILEMSDVFTQMSNVFFSLARRPLDQGATKAIAQEAQRRICEKCAFQRQCLGNGVERENAIASLCERGLARGKVNALDLPPYLSGVCRRQNELISVLNACILEYFAHRTARLDTDVARKLIGEQLKGVSDIMRRFSDEVSCNVEFDGRLEEALMEAFALEGMDVRDVMVISGKQKQVNLTVQGGKQRAAAVCELAGKVLGEKLSVARCEVAPRKNYATLSLRAVPKFDAVFGSSNKIKDGSNVSGDTHSLIHLSDDRMMLALCDGMGSGESAERMSNHAISLVENFYRAGFDDALILETVNRLLAIGNAESFAALDIVIIDLGCGTCDFIKIGSSASFVKRKTYVDVVEANSLPLGILEDVKPTVRRTSLEKGDVVVLATDGIEDAFSQGELSDFLANGAYFHPQALADELLSEAYSRQGKVAKDDMTVLAVRIV